MLRLPSRSYDSVLGMSAIVQQRSGMLVSGLRAPAHTSVPRCSRARKTTVRMLAFREGRESEGGREQAPLAGYSQPDLGTTYGASTFGGAYAVDLWQDVKARWKGVAHKRSWLVGAAGVVLAAWLGNTVLGRVDNLPLLPNLLLFIGLLQSGQFFWSYVLFGKGRAELRRKLASAAEQFRDAVEGQDAAPSQFVVGGDGDAGLSGGNPLTLDHSSSGSSSEATSTILSGDAGGASQPSAAQLMDMTPLPPYPGVPDIKRSA
ncbi:hypothetical protein QJQ45_023362 [Haematococcus lacustris]|nr:hypothetical protein QJQ45_023362 [Haematococcus lacustris]